MASPTEPSEKVTDSGHDSDPPSLEKSASLRLWPAIVIVVLMWAVKQGTAWYAPETMIHFLGSMAGPSLGLLLIFIWWLFASRVPWRDRWLGLALVVVLGGVANALSHPTIGIQAVLSFISPWAITAAVALLVLGSQLPWPTRRWLPAAVVAGAAAVIATFRVDGLDGDLVADFSPRWAPTQEELFLSNLKDVPAETKAGSLQLPLEPGPTDWPEFRGAQRDGRVIGVSFSPDWEASPPRERWRREIGPGWSSFTVIGDTIFTQEQRGAQEVVAAYAVDTGEPRWINQVESRFEETVGGAGPRATPTYCQGKLYTQGAGGKMQCVDAATGQADWVRDLTVDTATRPPMWGFSSSPLVCDDLVVTYAGASSGESVIAYRREDGEVAWKAGDSKHSYSSPQLATISGVEQILVSSDAGLSSFNPTDGELLWKHAWDIEGMARIVQPLVLDNDILLGTGYGYGTQRITVTNNDGSWTTTERWLSKKMKPYFNDFVQHQGYLYGFDGKIFACIELENGKLAWKRGRYGHGQVILLEEMGVLLVLGEAGELVLLEANPDKHVELAKIQALEGKTWNHPVVSGNLLFVRNGVEAVCYELNADVPEQVAIR